MSKGSWYRKLDRAGELSLEIAKIITDFLARKPYSIFGEVNASRTEYTFRMQVREDPPDVLPILIGDCLQNLRATLEHVAWRLVERGTEQPDRNTTYPIKINEPDWFVPAKKGGGPAKGCGVDRLRGADPAALKIVRQFQPFNNPTDPKRDPLYVIDKLAAIDRHRLLHVVGGSTRMTRHGGGPLEIADSYVTLPDKSFDGVTLDDGPFRSGQVVGRVTQSAGMQNAATCQVWPEIVFAEGLFPGHHLPVVETLGLTALFLNDQLVPALRPFL